jgi:hypothetical protein
LEITQDQTMTLERLIDQQITLGLKNPHDCFPALERQLGTELLDYARPYLADFISGMARQKLNTLRRNEIAKITPQTVADPEVKLRSLWVPDDGQGITYKRIADMTADDFDARAGYLERMLVGLSRHIGWCRNVAAELRRQNLATAGQLGQLPELPEIDDLRN